MDLDHTLAGRLNRTYALFIVLWTALIGVSLWFNLQRDREDTYATAVVAARANINKDIAFRKWASSHGGVYVTPNETTPPNPYLKVPNRDVVTTTGTNLTLMNPAYMLREMMHEFSQEYGIISKITSLKPLNPNNKPDEWEEKALKAFEQGKKEVLEVQDIGGKPYLRLLLPFYIDETCLKCHSHQGYEVGDIRGGIGSSVALAPYIERQNNSATDLYLSHGGIWLFGIIGLTGFFIRNRRLTLKHEEAERRLVESELQYRTLANSGTTLIWTSGPDKLCNYFNQVWLDFTGRPLGKELGNGWAEGVHPDDLQRCLDIYVTAFDRREKFQMEYRLQRGDGEYRWIMDQGSPRYASSGEFLGYIGNCMDITERKDFEKALKQASERFKAIIETSPIPMAVNDNAQNITYLNDAFIRTFGYTLNDIPIVADWWPKAYPDPSYRAKIQQEWNEHLKKMFRQGGDFEPLEVEIVARSGEVRTALVAATPLPEGLDSIHLVTLVDITERKRTELELAQHRHHLEEMITERTLQLSESVEKFKALSTLAPVGIYMTNTDGKCQYANPRWCEMAGMRMEDALGDGWVTGLHPDDRSEVFAHWQQMLNSDGRWGMEYRFKTPEGKVNWVYGLAVPTYDAQHKITGYLGVNLDITERKQAEDALKRAKAAAESANIAKSAFLANMSHEIRTPLNAITGMAHIIRKAGLSESQSLQMDKLVASSNHLLDIINDILDLSKIEAGKMVLEDVPVNIGELVGGLQAMLQERLSAKNLQLNLELSPLPTGLSGDATRLRQALLNYLTNAIKFTSQGTITLRVLCEQQSSTQVCLRFVVKDSGIGIEPSAMQRLFSAFEQADNSMTRKYGGTGLGLVITRRLAQLMGGDAGGSSALGVGSTFWFTATLAVKGVESPKIQKSNAENVSATLKQEYAGARVLLVEDEPINCEITELILAEVGIHPDIAADGQIALDKVRHQDYDLILMDMQMPVMNGLEATLHIRQLVKASRVPIIAMTANAFEEDRQRCLSVGMNDFLSKPIDPDGLFAMMLKWLSQPKAEPSREPTRLNWDQSFSVGHAEMDGQHQKLFALCNRLLEIKQGTGSDANEQFSALLQELAQYAEDHFTAEEAMLKRIHYPFLAEQEAEHLGYVQQIQHLVDEAKAGQTKMPETYDFLVRWLTHHILVSDMKYRPFV